MAPEGDHSPTADGAALEVVLEDLEWSHVDADIENLAAACFRAVQAALDDASEPVRTALSLTGPMGGAALLLADDAALERLNGQFRGKPQPTNVLAFPSGEEAFIGDIAIARETCVRQAAALGKPVRDHLAHLIVHGLLHLIGLDHHTDEDAERMETMEALVLARIGVEAPYADRPDAVDGEIANGGAR
ncbi:MAG: rRNA maturation RNase YbeY [Pseudomonadota bacterium]